MVKEFDLITNPSLRRKYIEDVSVLERVKGLNMLPSLTIATTKQVAEFYCVEPNAIHSLIHDHKDELVSDGYSSLRGGVIIGQIESSTLTCLKQENRIEKAKGGNIIDGKYFIPHAPVGVFPKRAILRVGMLLRDSLVAKEVRTMILNGYENKPFYTPVKESKIYTEEDGMLLDIVNGVSKEERALALGNYKRFKDNQVHSMENHLNLVESQFGALVKNLGRLVDVNKDNLMLLERKQ